jgi:hypothetical protein
LVNAFRRALVLTHRWLGIAGSALFVVWFASGIVMMYARMPRLSPEERLWRLGPLDLMAAHVDVADVVRGIDGQVQRVRVGMLAGRPAYRLQSNGRWMSIFADSGERVRALTPVQALRIASEFSRAPMDRLGHDARLEQPDQWTLQIRPLLPAHRILLNDGQDTTVYVSEALGEVVLVTTRRSRRLGYLGAVMHWLYFTPLRQNGPAWTQVVIWTSAAGCLLCASGLVWGIWQLIRVRRSPYPGLMRWHHYAGLLFGVVTFTFVFSGLLSMSPFDWSPSTSPTRTQREAVSGGALAFDGVTIQQLQSAVQALRREVDVKEIELTQFRGRLYAEAYQPPAALGAVLDTLGDPGDVMGARLGLDHRLAAVDGDGSPISRFADGEIAQAARMAMPGVSVRDEMWLADYDSYYYDRDGRLPIPVWRVRFMDPAETWLYLDPYRGTIIRKEERLSRLNRWLYRGFHSLDFPWLYRRRPSAQCRRGGGGLRGGEAMRNQEHQELSTGQRSCDGPRPPNSLCSSLCSYLVLSS